MKTNSPEELFYSFLSSPLKRFSAEYENLGVFREGEFTKETAINSRVYSVSSSDGKSLFSVKGLADRKTEMNIGCLFLMEEGVYIREFGQLFINIQRGKGKPVFGNKFRTSEFLNKFILAEDGGNMFSILLKNLPVEFL